MSGRSDRCLGTPASATALLLRGQAHSNRCFGASASAMTLLLRGKARSDQCFGTPASVTALLLVLRHFCYVSRHVSVQYCTIPSGSWCTMPISFMVPGLGKRL